MYLCKVISVLFFTSCWISPVLTQSTYYTFSPDSLEGSTDFLFSGEDDIGPCPKGTYFSYQLCVECPPGHICPGNVSAARRCPAGTFNLHPGKSSVKDCKSCLPGLISSEDRVDCRLCPAGLACDPDSGSLSPCPPGLYSPEGPLQCLACPLGSVCPSGYPLKCGPGKEADMNQTECVDCLPGFYSTLCSAHCFQCPAGSHCPGRGTSRPLPCPPGQSSLPGQSRCRQCNGTSWQCGGAATPRWTASRAAQRPSTSQVTCGPGTYRDPGDEGPDCLTCPLGHYCVGGPAVSCPGGTYGPKEGIQRLTDCPPCPAGFYCLEGSMRRPGAQFLCPQGYYCEEGTATPHGSPCPPGTAGTQLGQTSRAACKRCAEGRFCPAGSADPGLPCARGRYCPAGTMEEVICPQGTFTPHQGMISVKGCLKCPAGFYCPEGTSDPVPCHPGTFNPLEGQDDVADCRDCYPGKACTKIALRAPDQQCMQGFVCPPGSSKPNALANACPPGTLSDQTDLTDRSQCQRCPARYACLRGTGGAQRPPLSCFPGHYCPPGTMFPTQYKCPVGMWSGRSGLETENECQVCPRGWYCLAGSGVPSGRCGSGHYCPEGTIYGSQFPCHVGTYSIRMGNGHRNDCLVCPEGSYCPEGTSKPAPCPPSTFRAIKGGQRLEDCSACPAGYFCPLSATVRPRACGAGSYSDEASVQCLPCLRGHYCSNETTSEETMLSVMVCPAGFLCSQGLARDPQRSATLCPRGFYCPGGANDPDLVPCPNGTYSDSPGLRDVTECVQCPQGQYCYSSQPWEQPITQPTGACPDGHHCPLGTGYPYTFPCQPGQYRNNTHSHGGEACVSCPSRNYCRRPGTHTPAACPVGFYCPEGSAAPEPCPEGTYSSRAALRSRSECSPCGGGRYCIGVGLTEPSGSCAEGFYCREGAKSATPANGPTGGLCPIGSYCVAGSSFPSPCPPGTFSNSVGLTTPQQCVRCPPGYYCSGYNNTAPSGPCLPGFYCTGGSAWPVQHDAEEGHFTSEGAVRAVPCPLGTFQPGRGGQSCVQCAGGRLCNQTGLSRPPLCPTGHYCPRGATVARPCPPGTYADEAGGEDAQHCRPCDAGWFCSRAALSQPQGPCNPGHYCIMGASTASPALGVSTGGVCPAGFVCPSGTRYPRQYPCPAGTWSSTMGARDLTSNCVPCPPGLYCNSTGLRQPSGACGAGYYCSERATTPMPSDGVTGDKCPVGHYCPPGSASPVPCPDGQHSNVTGAAECEDCPPGTYCLSGEGVQLCPVGHYCLGGSVEAILPCPPGTYSPERALSQVEQCLICPAGLYCEEWGLYEPTGPCQAGYFCLAGINFRNPDGNFSTGVGGACPPGHYCPEGTGLPVTCPLGTYSNSLYLTEVGGCMWCSAGHFCGSVGLIRPSGPCHEGFYCPGGDSAATGSEGAGRMCPAAHYCPGGSANPVPCPAGTYATLTGQTHCSHCPAGHYCPESTAHFTQFPCPPGHYCLDGTRHASQFPCPRGYYNPEPMTQSLDSCLPCPPGHYCEKERLASVSGKCKAGWFCVSAAWTSQPFDLDNYTNANCLCPATSTGGQCQEGFYCPSGSSEPLPCPPGTFCNTSGLALPMGPCSPGYFCIEGATEPRPSDGDTGSICPPGTYCVEGSDEPELCPAGTFSPVPGLSSEDGCRPCTAGFHCARQGLRTPTGPCSQGYWCPPGQTVPMGTPCPPRYSCPHGSAAPEPCPPGTYQDQEKQAACDVCRAGFYCDLSVAPPNASALRPCPIGHYCPPGTVLASENPCPTGTFNPRERTHGPSDCMSCPPGQHCPDVGLSAPAGPCHAGYWCKEGAVSPSPLDGVTGFPCPPGQYCPSGTPAPLACPEGRWSNNSGLRSHEDCQPCPGGHYCHSAGLTAPTGLCTGGYYCVRGSVTSTPTDGTTGGPCPEGHHCPQGTTLPVPCDPGTYMTVPHATQCEACLPGWHCVSGALYLCPAGFFCPEGTGYDMRGCPAGTYSPEAGLWASSQCRPCDGGHYCSSANATTVTGPCQQGHYCSRGSTSPRPVSRDAGEGGLCPAGYYCPAASSQPLACPHGTFSNVTQLTSQEDCQPCEPGYYCDAVGLTAPPGACWEGFYCLGGSQRPDPPSRDSRGGPCPRGHYCVEGSNAPLECPRGTISMEEGQAFCSPCPQGSYCPSGNGSLSQSSGCPAGHYCPTGTGDGHQHPCPAGSVNPHTRMSQPEDCLPCPAGSFCAWPGQAQVTGQCDAGYYCLSAARSATPQDGGLTGDRCPEGHYCPQGSSVPFFCPLGHYSNKTRNTQISDCLICPPGFLCSSRGLSLPSHVCPAGSYCPHRHSSSLPASLQCLPGNMCPPGSASPVPCMPGAYQDLAGQAECMTCPAGSYCHGTVDEDTRRVSGTVTPVPCPEGHYCPPGTQSAVAFPCPAGTVAGQTGVSGEEGCERCPPGKYCSSSGLASPTGDCSPGYICIQGSVHPQPEGGRCPPGSYCPLGSGYMSPCPVGTFNNIEGGVSSAACQPCLPGHYCAREGLWSPSAPCNPGFYCLLGASSATPWGNGTFPLPGGGSGAQQPQTHGGDRCPAGHYCPEGSTMPSLCPPGTFLGRSGAESEAECEACSPGFYCPSWAQTSADDLCPEGWFCPPGSVSGHQPEYQCPPGNECPHGSAEPTICSPGTFQASSGQPACDTCPPGFYCIEGTSVPSACPRGSVNAAAGRTSLSDCSPCPPGSFCNSTALTHPSGPCSPGHFCALGASGPSPVSQPYGDVCPVGHFCPEGSSSAKPCPAGSYLSQPGASAQTHCQPCPPGTYCLTAGASQPTGPCSPGFYCSRGSDSPEPRSNSSLISCLCGSMGFYTTEPDPCLWKHNLSCSDSPATSGFDAGWMEMVPGPWSELCQNVTTTAPGLMGTHHACATFRGDVCPRGFYCPLGSAVPQPCDAGSHCNRTGLQAPAGPCHEGYLCPRGSADPHASLCPTGHYCPRGSPVPLPCPPGTMKSFAGGSGVEACEECPPGYYCQQSGLARPSGRCAEGYHCPQGQTSARPQQHVCSAGHYCEKGSARQTACVPGSYQPSDGQDSCEPCPAGFYCQDQGMELPLPCERGFYCPSGSAGQHPCPAGTYSNHSGLVAEHQCSPCGPGMYCRGPGRTSPSGPCSAGFVCLGGASEPSPLDNLSGSPCPSGFFCPEGTSTPRPCPKGTFSESSGLVEAYQCRSCSPGFYCSAPGLSAVSGPCLPGFYCLEGSQSSTPAWGGPGGVCPAGHYCERGTSVPAPCPAGTYHNHTGGKTQDSCTPCPHGWFQYLSGQRECNACPPGFHCQTPPSTTSNDSWSSTGASSPLPCPPGYICPGESPERPPAPCPLGTYSSTQGLTTTGECVACPAGQFCGSEGLMGPSGPCAAGFLCLTGATVPNPKDNTTGSPCPPGVFCQDGLISGECWPGFYCDWGSSRPDQSLCPAGFFCPRGTPSALACPAGTFSAAPGITHQDNCTICPAAYYCLGEGTVQPALCPAGHYCPPGLVLGVEFPCPSGTVQGQPGASSLGACLPCPAGMFCSLPGLSEPTGQCEAGYLCLAGSTSPNAMDYEGNSSRSSLCPVGHYCPAGTGYPLPCPTGTLSPSLGLRGIEECPPCPPGLFCDRPALAELSDALPCHAGYVCQGGSSTATPVDRNQGYLCPAGHSCPAGSSVEVPCVPGTYSAALGAAHCSVCPSGTMCPSTGTEEPGVCTAGHFCPAGTVRPLPCPPGTFSNQTGAHSESVCTACPTGFYCSTYGASVPEGPCQQGYFCHGGASAPTPDGSDDFPRNGPCPVGHYCPSGSLTPLPCPMGSIRNSTGGVSVEGCSGCPSGHYCSTEGLAGPSGMCAAGFYCPFDVSSTTPHTFLCPKGHFCPEGSPLALPCPTGEYQPNPGSDGCIPCRPGFYCEEAVVGDPLPCPPHSFCPAATMVPQPCPHGTYTPPQQRGLQEERECLPCPPAKYCRAGKIQGVCAAGYLCLSGSAAFTPQGHVTDGSHCEGKMQCAGTCPPGFFCPEGALRAEPCPANTIRRSPGGASIQDCLPCPPQHWCKAGDPVLYPCPAGHYCDGYGASAGPRECPYYTYRALPGAGSKGDCLPCPPGTHCNSTGLTDYSNKPCPPGYWCSGTGRPILCPAGTKRPLPGGAAPGQCEPCAGGTYCPDPRTAGQPNVEGIPCRASYQCPPGAVSEKLCRAGSYCGPQTAEPKVCPAGYFCPQGSQTYNVPKQLCPFPYYCPANSSHMRSCDGGSMPVKTNGFRGSKGSCCVACEGGTYRPYLSPFLQCLPCPGGYHCPPGADVYRSNPCPLGHVCPVGSSSPVACRPGTFGNLDRAERTEDCLPCPAGTFNHLAAQKACFPCGSSSTSTAGSSSCTCIGKNRAFQHSDGSCLCRTGFIFYNQLDFKISTADSELDCQPEVNRRCVTGEVRLAATRECVSPNLYDCNVTCGAHGGTLDVEMGICQCERYVSAEELCNTSCMSRLPHLSGQLSPDGQLLLNLSHRDHARGWARNVMDVIGPDIHVKDFGKIHFVQFDHQGVYGWILKDRTLVNHFLSDPVELLDKRPRKKTDTEHVDAVSSSGLPRIPNPIACISSSDMLIFQLTINHTDRHLSHFPVYQKDHLFNSNPSWDFGAFRHLETLMKQTHFNSTRFAHVFSERGKYVFVNNAVPQWSMVVVVSEQGTECDPRAASFQPMTPAQLVRFGIVKEHRLNLLPDWELITGVLSVLLVVVVVVTTTVLVMRPNKAKLISQWRSRPRWRSLGEPIPLAEYLYNGDSLDGHMQTGLLGSRGEGEGAEAEEPAVSKGVPPGRCNLEEFNVKTLYDKLEDQNLHLASQLARHRKHTQDFYRNICQQTDVVRNVLENMDSKKLNVLKELLDRDAMRSKASSSGVRDRDAEANSNAALLGAVLRSVEAVLNRLSGECWQSQDLQCELHPGDTRTTDTHMGSAQFSPTNMTKTEAPPTDSGHAQSTCLSEQDLSKLVAMSPLSRTLQEIQQSLQNLTTAQPVITEAPMEDDPGSLIPVALDTLSPQHSAVFLFGCQVMCLLGKCPLFPPVLLLLARSLPGSHCTSRQGLLTHCLGDFYFDSGNQILYLSEAKLQHVGEFISTILQSMAYVASGSRLQSFMQALHQGISAVSLHLFNSSFTWDSTKTKRDAAEASHSPLVEDFLNVRVPTEELFTERLLAGRLQQYKCFKLEQLIGGLKQWPSRQNGKGMSPKGTPVQMSCVEQEIDALNESFLDLSVQLEKRVQINTWQREREHSAASQAKPSSSPELLPSLSRNGTVVLELRRRYVLQRLDELQLTLGRIRERQEVEVEEEGTADQASIDGSAAQQQQQQQHSQQENINGIYPGSPTSEGETSEGGGVDTLEVDNTSEPQAQSDEAVQRSGPETSSLAGGQPPPPAENRDALHSDVKEEREVDRAAAIENTAGPTHTAVANLDVNIQ